MSTALAALLCKRIVYAWEEYKEYEEEEAQGDGSGDIYSIRRRQEEHDDEYYEEYEELESSGIPVISYVSTSSVIVGLCAIQL